MKKMKRIMLSASLALIAAWQLYTGFLWSEAWQHYEAGGGVFVTDELNEEEMTLALQAFRKHSKYSPLSTKSRNYAGKALIELGRYEDALNEFNGSLSIRSTFTAHYRKAYALMKLERFDEMKSSLEEANEHSKDFHSRVRFTEEFGHLRDHPAMSEFKQQFRG